MEPFRSISTSEQLAAHLRRQIQSGVLKGTLPGVQNMVKTLGVNSMAVGKAIEELEREGLVIYQGDRKKRLIAENAISNPSGLCVGMLNYCSASALRHDMLSIRQELMNAGHKVVHCPKTMRDLKMRKDRVAKVVGEMDVDAWIIGIGTHEILEWFAAQDKPALSVHGRQMSIPIAGIAIRKLHIISDLVERLTGMGHRRISLLTAGHWSSSELGFFERSFLEILEANGIQTGPYNIPDWDNTSEGLKRTLDSLFQVTPPTALFVSDAAIMHSVQIYLASRGIFAPKDISLVCNDFQESFLWTQPQISHICWDHRPAVRRAAKWAKNLSQGKKDIRKTFIKARLFEGGTLGPARRG